MGKNTKLLVFGTGSFGEVASFYFKKDSEYEPVAFVADSEYVEDDSFKNKPLVEFEEVTDSYPPSEYDMFVAIGDNHIRAKKCEEAREKGYNLASYLCSKISAWEDLKIGANSFIFEDQTIQPFVDIGENVVIWSGNHIGHHSSIDDHCFITSHIVISGHTVIKPYAYLGVNSTLVEDITIGRNCTIGAGAVIIDDTEPDLTYVGNPGEPL